MKKKNFISITGLSAIATLPISIISCGNSSDNTNILLDNNAIETNLKNDTNQNLIFTKIAESNKIWDNVQQKILKEIQKNENETKILNKYYLKKYSPAFTKYFDYLETISSKLDSEGEISKKIDNLKNKNNEIDYQNKIDDIIEELKMLKTNVLDFFVDSYKSVIENSKKENDIEFFKKFDLKRAFYWDSFSSSSEFYYMYRPITKTHGNPIAEKIQDTFKQLKLGYILKASIKSNDHTKQHPFDWKPDGWTYRDKENIEDYFEKNEDKEFMKNSDEYFKYSGIFAGRIIEAEIIQRIRMLSILKAFNLNISNEKAKASFQKSNSVVIQKLANSLINNEIIEFIENIQPTFRNFKPDFLLQKLKDESKKLLPEFYEKNKPHFVEFENSIKKIEKSFIGIDVESSDVTKRGVIFIMKSIQKTLKSIPLEEVSTITELNGLNLKVNTTWELVKNLALLFSSFEKDLNIILGFRHFLEEPLLNKINKLKEKSLNSEIKQYEDFMNFWDGMGRKSNEYFWEIEKQKINLRNWLEKFISFSTFVDSYLFQLAIDNFDNIKEDNLIFDSIKEKDLISNYE